MICPHCRSSNPETALRCTKCGLTFSLVDEGETMGPSSGTAASAAPQPAPPSVASGVLSPPPGGQTPTPASFGGWTATASGSLAIEPGTEFGNRYRIECMLGEGGMGAVYKAYDKDLDRTVALKLLRPGMMLDPSALQRFKQELLLASKISHKNILRIHDLGDVGGIKFISMAFVEGSDLHGILKQQGRLTTERAVAIMRQLCAALDAAHAEGVIHRDLKPHNVLMDAQGNAYISDFGLAKSVEAGAASMTRAGEFLGTPRYMSPEQVQGGKLDHRSDLYSLGLMLYEMVTGDVPFTSESTLNLMYQRVKEKPKRPEKANPDVPAYLSNIIMRCLEKDPDRRFQTAGEILEALNVATGGVSRTGSRTASRTGATSIIVTLPPPERRKWWYLGGVVLLLLVIAMAIPGVRHRILPGTAPASTGPQTPITVLVADFNNATGDPVFDGTLEPAFSIAMEGAAFISAYNRADARRRGAQLQEGATTLNEAVARLVAVREGINVVVLGSIRRQGEQYKLRLEAVDGVTGSNIADFETEAEKKDVLVAVSKLAARIRTALGDATPESLQLAGAETFSASSLEAAQAYARAQDFQWTGKWDDAIQQYTRAIGLDPELGRAYSGLAAVYSNMGRLSEADNYYKLAFSKIDRMTNREKFRTRSGYYLAFRNTDKAIEELTQLTEKYPSDTAGRANLALAYFYRRDMAKALEVGRAAVELSPRNVPQRNNLGLYAMYAGDFQAAIDEQRKVLEMNASFVPAYLGIALAELGSGKTVEATGTFNKMESLSKWGASTSATGLADVALYEGRAKDAVTILEKGIQEDSKNSDSDSAALKLAMLAEAYAAMGQSAKALAKADEAVAASQRESVMFWAAQTYIALGRESKAVEIAGTLAKRLESDPQAYAKLIEGEILLNRGKPQDALREFQASRKLADTWLGRFDSARAYIEAEAYAEAGSELENCLKRRGEGVAAFLDEVPTARLLPLVYYYQGRAQEGLKSPAAKDSYQAFLATKKNGAQDPLVADARRRIQ